MGPRFTSGRVRRLFEHEILRYTIAHRCDVSAAGRRFGAIETVVEAETW